MLQKIKNWKHLLFAVLANIIYGFPAQKLTVIGVTGTDGKTTTTSLIYWILLQSKKRVAKITTVGSEINGEIVSSSLHTTTPDSFALQKFIREAVNSGCDYLVMEVSSHGIDQKRIWGIPFAIGALTNITNNEHLDYHGNFENYKQTKLRFLKSCRKQFVNQPEKNIKYKSQLLGKFNEENINLAAAVCQSLGISQDVIVKAVESFSAPPGRLEMILRKPFTVIVDFAHTPGAFEKILPVARSFKTFKANKLIHVFGATGERDKSKRPLMAQIAAKFDDYIFLTHEDTYLEDKMVIIKDLENGLITSGFKNYKIITERKEAILHALKMAGPGDVVILTGVGHQTTMNIGGTEIPWSDQNVVKNFAKNAS